MLKPQPRRSTLRDFVYPIPLKVRPAVAFTYLWLVANILAEVSRRWKIRSSSANRFVEITILEESEIDVPPVVWLNVRLILENTCP